MPLGSFSWNCTRIYDCYSCLSYILKLCATEQRAVTVSVNFSKFLCWVQSSYTNLLDLILSTSKRKMQHWGYFHSNWGSPRCLSVDGVVIVTFCYKTFVFANIWWILLVKTERAWFLFAAGRLPEGLQMIVSLEGDLTDAQKERLVEVSGFFSCPTLAAQLNTEI